MTIPKTKKNAIFFVFFQKHGKIGGFRGMEIMGRMGEMEENIAPIPPPHRVLNTSQSPCFRIPAFPVRYVISTGFIPVSNQSPAQHSGGMTIFQSGKNFFRPFVKRGMETVPFSFISTSIRAAWTVICRITVRKRDSYTASARLRFSS